MNLFQKALHQLLGIRRGEAEYRQAADAMKATAPITGPLVGAILAKAGLPANGQSAGAAAVQVLTQAAVSKLPLPAGDANLLSEFVSQHVGLLVPPVVSVPPDMSL